MDPVEAKIWTEEPDQTIERTGNVQLVVIDPISEYLGKTDSHSNSEIRGLLSPLAELAAKHDVAVLSVTHLNKPGSGATNKAIYRAMGSLAFGSGSSRGLGSAPRPTRQESLVPVARQD